MEPRDSMTGGPMTYAMKIENLLEPSEKEKKAGVTKKQPVPPN